MTSTATMLRMNMWNTEDRISCCGNRAGFICNQRKLLTWGEGGVAKPKRMGKICCIPVLKSILDWVSTVDTAQGSFNKTNAFRLCVEYDYYYLVTWKKPRNSNTYFRFSRLHILYIRIMIAVIYSDFIIPAQTMSITQPWINRKGCSPNLSQKARTR